MLPVSSQHGAAMKAASTGTSPVMSARARPPWLRTTIGQVDFALAGELADEAVDAGLARASSFPLRMNGMISACTGWTELDAMVMSRMPIASISCTSRLSRRSPLRRW